MKKTALLLSWWGMKSSFTAWVLLWLSQQVHSKRLNPDICIAWSWSAWTATYYLAKQYDSIENIRSNLLTTKQTINLSRINKIIDIDFIIDSVFRNEDPLNTEKVLSAKTDFYIPAFNTQCWTIDYLYQNWKYDLLESLRATKAMPIVYRYIPQIPIWEHTYCDSIGSSQWIHHIQFAIDQWATEILLVNNSPSNTTSGIDETLFKLRLYTIPKQIRNTYVDEIITRREYTIPKNISVQIITPESKLPAWSLNNKKSILETCINAWKIASLVINNI
jgi:predicted patatin/cPLA2 family phospholipase